MHWSLLASFLFLCEGCRKTLSLLCQSKSTPEQDYCLPIKLAVSADHRTAALPHISISGQRRINAIELKLLIEVRTCIDIMANCRRRRGCILFHVIRIFHIDANGICHPFILYLNLSFVAALFRRYLVRFFAAIAYIVKRLQFLI